MSIDQKQSSLAAQGKTVTITGGAREIGAAIASSFAAASASELLLKGPSLPQNSSL